MRSKRSLIIGSALAVAIVSLAAWWLLALNHPPLAPMVSKALFHEKNTTFYTATANVSTPYQGKAIESEVTILHSRNNEEIIYPSTTGRGMYSKTTGSINQTYMPKTNTLMLSKTSSLITPNERAKLLLANYKPEYAGTDNVAGQPAYVIRLVPKRQGRPSRELWIDRNHSVILRTLDYSYSGTERGGTEFTHIEYTTASDPSLIRPVAGNVKKIDVCRPSTLPEMNKLLGVKITEPKYIPAGYKLEGRHIYNSPCGTCKSAAQLTYTDGLSVISVFQSPTKPTCNMPCCKNKAPRPESCQMTCCELAQSGRITTPDKTIVVVADLPPTEIEKIAKSVK